MVGLCLCPDTHAVKQTISHQKVEWIEEEAGPLHHFLVVTEWEEEEMEGRNSYTLSSDEEAKGWHCLQNPLQQCILLMQQRL